MCETERAKPWPGMRRRSNAAAPRCARGSLRCSIAWPAAKLASLPAVVALGQSPRVRSRSARCARAATRSALLGAAYVAAGAHPTPALPAPPWRASSNSLILAARWAVPGVGDLWGGEKASPDTDSPVDWPCLASDRAARPGAACKASDARGSPAPQATDRRGRREVCGAFSAADGGTAAALVGRASQRSRRAAATATS
ncbi:MAG: hypothetical protein LKCHEGNO_03403 [Burkholderiaceae bacterium]|nr:hypothetical protein [Burkholderiaceae bacterium]